MDISEEGDTSTPEPEPKVIGLTGGIGSGKTTVAKYIEQMGYPVYNSDQRAKEIVNIDPLLKTKIIELLGPESYNTEGEYNRAFVSSVVFENSQLLTSLNHLIHPAVKKDFENWTRNQSGPYVFKETALLFELGLDKECYKSILVTAEDNIRIKRVMDRDSKTYREVENVMDQQMAEKDKVRKTSFIIYNNEDLIELKEQTTSVLEKLFAKQD
ncbi:dephospho-CoA kinase [Chryseobacterium sp. A301]